MSTRFYDEALIKKLTYWTKSTNAKIYSPSDTKKLFEVVADESDDGPIKLPIICVRRNGGFQVKNTNRQPLSYSAQTIEKSNTKTMKLNAIPIELRYQLDIYTRYFDEADEFARNLIFNIINFPSLTVVLRYLDQDIEHKSTIQMTSDVEDNSDIPERFVQGNFTRLTINLTIPDAYIWDVRLCDTSSVVGGNVGFLDDNQTTDDDGQLDGKGVIIREI